MEHYKNTSLEDIQYLDADNVLCTEKWLPIKFVSNVHFVSDLGRVKLINPNSRFL